MKMPDPNSSVELLKDNLPKIEILFLQWAQEHSRTTGKFPDEAEANLAVQQLMVDFVFENLGDPSLRGPMETVAKKSMAKILKSTGIFELQVQVTPSDTGTLRCHLDLSKGISE